MNEPDQLASLIAENAALRRENAELQRQLDALAARCRTLETRLAQQAALVTPRSTTPLPHPPLDTTSEAASRQLGRQLREVRRVVLARALAVPPAVPVPEQIRRLSALHVARFYDAFADFVVDGNDAAFNLRREPIRRALLNAGLPTEVAFDIDRLIAQELAHELPEYASTIRTRLARSQMLITETNINRYFD